MSPATPAVASIHARAGAASTGGDGVAEADDGVGMVAAREVLCMYSMLRGGPA